MALAFIAVLYLVVLLVADYRDEKDHRDNIHLRRVVSNYAGYRNGSPLVATLYSRWSAI